MSNRSIFKHSLLFLTLLLALLPPLLLSPETVTADILKTGQGLEFKGKCLGVKGKYLHFRTEEGIVLKFSPDKVSVEIETTPDDAPSDSPPVDAKAMRENATVPEDVPYTVTASTSEYEEVVLQTGGTVKGLIESITDEELEMSVITGKSSIANATFPIDQICGIKRLTESSREKLKENIQWIRRTGPGGESFKRVGQPERGYDPVVGECWKLTTAHFHIAGESAESFIRAIALRMEQMFEAYHSYFNVPVSNEPFVKILIFPSYTKYARSMEANKQLASPRVAGFYVPDLNMIVTHQEYENFAAEAETYVCAIAEIERKIASLREVVDAMDGTALTEAKEERRDIAERERAIKKYADDQIYRLNENSKDMDPSEYNRRRDQIEEWRRKELDAINKEWRLSKENYGRTQESIRELDILISQRESLLDRERRFCRSLLIEFEKSQLQTLYHEAWHAYVDHVIKRDQENAGLPLWLEEGLAEFFSNSEINVAEVLVPRIAKGRLITLKLAGNDGLIPLRQLVRYTKKEGYAEQAELFYAQSWGFIYYLNEKFDLRNEDLLLQYIDDLEQEGDPINAFESTFEMNLDVIEKDFKAWILSRPIE